MARQEMVEKPLPLTALVGGLTVAASASTIGEALSCGVMFGIQQGDDPTGQGKRGGRGGVLIYGVYGTASKMNGFNPTKLIWHPSCNTDTAAWRFSVGPRRQ